MLNLEGGRDTIEDKFQQTMRISQKIKRAGYNLIEVWECEIDREILANADMHEFMESNELVKIKPLDPRDCFFGGRVENTAKYLEGDMKYFDIRSLYPFVCKTGEYPIGHPTIYIGKECQKLTGSKNDDITNVHGIVKCNVLPPRDLYHPVLPVRMHGKLLFSLCRTCCEQSFQRECCHENVQDRILSGTWVANELRAAIAHGYKIVEVFEIWEHQMTKYNKDTNQGGILAEYINEFFAKKTKASGYPSNCETDEQKDRYLREMEEKEGIKLKKEDICDNPGERAISKMVINSLWGKLAQTENLGKMEVITDPSRLFDLALSLDIEVNSWLPVNEEAIYLGWTHRNECAEISGLTNVVLAEYTTAQARLKLFSYISRLDERCVYFDTDSVIF